MEVIERPSKLARAAPAIPTVKLAEDLHIRQLLIGLWQVADLEREGGLGLDRSAAISDLQSYADAGLTSFDMADHYGSSEELVGEMMQGCNNPREVVPLTKWVPKPGSEDATEASVNVAVERALTRLRLKRLPLLQFHTWDYLDGPGTWLQQLRLLAAHKKVDHIGLTNVDAEHLRLALAEGLPVVSNQVCFSLLDRRAAGAMSEVCNKGGVKLLAFGVLAGGLLTDVWLGRAEPNEEELAKSWSLAKYFRFVRIFGGWHLLQDLLVALRRVADKHHTTIAAIAIRWVLDHPAVGSVIVGARIGRSSRLGEHAKPFQFGPLSVEDLASIKSVLSRSTCIPGCCGDEYRREPFLTASGDLSHHLSTIPLAYKAAEMPGHCNSHPKLTVSSSSVWEGLAGFSRATRVGSRIAVSGTTATCPVNGKVIGGTDAGAQTVFAFDIVEAALKALGAGLQHVTRTRLYVRNVARDWEAVARIHGLRFARAGVKPANTLVGAQLVGEEYLVEVEVEADLLEN